MLDFTAALYLGLRHASRSLRPWEQLTNGVPAALAAPPGMKEAADRLAALIGCDRATLGPSTLHLFWDLFGMLGGERIGIYMDAGLYPIARWGIERATARGVPLQTFPHDDVDALRRLIRRDRHRGLRPIVVTDGFCPGCGRHAPIAAYLEDIRAYGGQLILDDTQALGIFGHSVGADAPYGRGGGGSLRWRNVAGPDVIVVSSLAKAFGVPVALLAGSRAVIECFEERSETRVHCSPPSLAAIHAAEHALNVNDRFGDALRLHLAQHVRYFRQRLSEARFNAVGGLFPVQTLRPTSEINVIDLHERLRQRGIATVLHQDRNGSGPRLSFLITTRHRRDEIDRLTAELASGVQAGLRPQAAHG